LWQAFTNSGRRLDGLIQCDCPRYTLREENLLQHADIMQGWEHKLQFVIKGRDAPDGSTSTKKSK